MKFRAPASSSILNRVSARHAMLDTPSSMESANRSTSLPVTTLAALSGVTEFVSSAPRDGSSTQRRFAPPSVISAPPGMMPPERALLATTDQLFSLEPASPANRPSSMLSPTIFYARPGETTPALSAPIEPTSTPKESAPLSAHNATPLTRLLEIASLASMDMIMSMEAVSSHPLILPPPLILDAATGIGKDRNVSLALTDGPSTKITYVYLLLISAPPTTIREIA